MQKQLHLDNSQNYGESQLGVLVQGSRLCDKNSFVYSIIFMDALLEKDAMDKDIIQKMKILIVHMPYPNLFRSFNNIWFFFSFYFEWMR